MIFSSLLISVFMRGSALPVPIPPDTEYYNCLKEQCKIGEKKSDMFNSGFNSYFSNPWLDIVYLVMLFIFFIIVTIILDVDDSIFSKFLVILIWCLLFSAAVYIMAMFAESFARYDVIDNKCLLQKVQSNKILAECLP